MDKVKPKDWDKLEVEQPDGSVLLAFFGTFRTLATS